MSIIWTVIIIFCLLFSLFTNNFTNVINALFDVPEYALKLTVSLGGLIIIYNGIFQVAIDSKLIKTISFLFKPFIKKIYKINNDELLELLCANFTANLLGLGAASTPIAINVLKKVDNPNIINKLICMNVSSFTIFPFTIITLRNKYNGINNFKVWIAIIIITFLTTVFSLFICNIGEEK